MPSATNSPYSDPPPNPFREAQESLGRDYQPAYGTTITPESFVNVDGAWQVTAFDADGRPTLFSFTLRDGAPPEVTANGAPTVFRDIHSGAVREAGVADWFDAIAYWDAQARAAERQDARWSGDDMAAVFERVAAEVVEYRTHLCNLSNYEAPGDLAADLGRLLAPLAVTVKTVEAWPETAEHNEARRIVDGEDDKFAPIRFSSAHDPQQWLTELQDGHFRQHVWARFEGSRPTTFEAYIAYRLSELPAGVRLSEDPANPWWAIVVEEHDAVLPVPHSGACLDITVDHDGQSIAFATRLTEDVARERQLIDAFERRWGHLMNDRQPPSDKAVQEAIALAHARIQD